MSDITVTGLDTIINRLEELDQKGAGRVLSSIIRTQLNVIGKQMKSDTSKKVKEGRKGIRSRFKNKQKKNWIQAKVGFGVGKRRKNKPAKVNRKGNKAGGVGISAQNIHWWVAGTDDRTTGTGKGEKQIRYGTDSRGRAMIRYEPGKMMNRGRMPSMQPRLAAIAATKSRGKQNAEMIKRGALALKKEIIKLKSIG